MKKLLITFLLLLLSANVFAEPQLNNAQVMNKIVTTAVNVSEVPLGDFLLSLGKQYGLAIVATPEVAQLKISLNIAAGQTLEQVFKILSEKYNLNFKRNAAGNAFIAVAEPYRQELFVGAAMMQSMGGSSAKVMVESLPNVVPASPSTMPSYPVVHNTEEYSRINETGYQNALTSPLSTFSIDVDTASYSNMRRFINMGEMPPADAVRTEEMLNYFTYDYPQPTDGRPFSLTTEVGKCPWDSNHKLVLIGLQGKNINSSDLPPTNLVFLLDVSGSMDEPNKLPLIKTAMKMLVKQLRAEDRVAIVVYASSTGILLNPTSGSDKAAIIKAIDSLQAGGSTAGGEGLMLAYKVAKESYAPQGNNRVILATDGDFNVGASSEGELSRMIEAQRDNGISLSVLGFGMGNIKDNKMEIMADKGNGNYAYIDNAAEAKKVLVGQMAGTLYTIAKDVKLQVEFNPALVKSYRLIGYENRKLTSEDFNNDKKDAGDMGAGHTVTALYEIIPADSQETAAAVDPLIYQKPEILPSGDLLQVKVRYKLPQEENSVLFTQAVSNTESNGDTSESFRFAAAVAEYAMLLRDSEYKGAASYRQVLDLAGSAKGKDEQGYRAEFINMVRVSQVLAEK